MKPLLLLLLLFCAPGFGAAVGTHGMVLMPTSQGPVASHLPLHGSMHAHQLVLKLAVDPADKAQVAALLAQQPLVTLKPEILDLHRLMHGTLSQFRADVVAGHFERGGQTTLPMVAFTVERVLLNAPLEPVENGAFYPIDLGDETLLVHRIGSLPSFDQILLMERNVTESLIYLGDGQPLDDGLQPALEAPVRSLYLETADFTAR
ncbi:hypothetical protein [Ferrimonas balearica]|uniref:hypothetical protein n=1 Tax=Ferrimonas balearica TaxID=44012 RepID=UPI001C995592|nr:hypothetical protein [Ferrimonas balearica]MBY5991922.1 hypothetical protein [Ferrimonas balearica]